MKFLNKTLSALIISLVLSFVLFANGLKGDFVADDKLVILQNPLITGHWSDLGEIFITPYYYDQTQAGLYRPLTVASYNFNKFFSDSPFGFHLLNIVLNALNGFMVFLLVSKLVNKRTAYMAMVLFMFLPIHSEAVSSIVGRAELMSFLFSSLSLLFVLNKKYALASALLLAGLLSKETTAGFFLVFLYLWKFKEHQTLKQVLSNSLYFVPSIAVYALLRVYVLGKYFIGVDHLMAYNPLRFASFLQSLWTSFKVLYLYLFKTVVPYKLSFDYSFNQIPIIQNPFLHYEVYAGIFILVALVYLMVKKKENIYGLSAAVFLLVYLPVSNWFVKIGTIMGERLMYAPSLGLVILAAVIIQNVKIKMQNDNNRAKPSSGLYGHVKFKILNLSPKLFIFHFSLLTLLAWYGFVIIDRNRDWNNESALIRSGYAASPNSVVNLTNMAFLEFNDKNYQEARKWAEKAIKVLPDHTPALYLAGHLYKNLGDTKSAESAWLRIIKLSPGYSKAYLSLGILYYEEGRLNEAEAVLGKGFELERRWNEAFPLALVKINRGKYSEAINLIINNFSEKPERRELKFALGLAYLKMGDKIKAEFYLNQVKDPAVEIGDYFRTVKDKKVFKIEEY
ncbi:MAG: tetratricopeptide repeat protein [Patescibacteria group bacterium]